MQTIKLKFIMYFFAFMHPLLKKALGFEVSEVTDALSIMKDIILFFPRLQLPVHIHPPGQSFLHTE